jgi:SET domain-containing protein
MLVVRKSRIPNAGKGLFTTSPIRKGDVVVEYLGDKLTWKQVLKRYKDNLDEVRYVFCITDDNCIDAKPRKEELAQYANDANGGGKGGPFKNNCEYHIIKKRPYIVAIKNIPANSEILVDYGDEYWEALAENAEEEKLKQQKKKKGEIRIPRPVNKDQGKKKKTKAKKKATGKKRR